MINAWVQVLTVAFHESGHVLAGLATCARITSVEVDPELGGLTQMRGGIQWITLPLLVRLLPFLFMSIIACRIAHPHGLGTMWRSVKDSGK